MRCTVDDEPRSDEWKGTISRLDAAYKARGAVALEQMDGVEPLALWNEKVRDFKLISQQVEASPSEEASERREALLKEINHIGGWINAKQRRQGAPVRGASRKAPDVDLDR